MAADVRLLHRCDRVGADHLRSVVREATGVTVGAEALVGGSLGGATPKPSSNSISNRSSSSCSSGLGWLRAGESNGRCPQDQPTEKSVVGASWYPGFGSGCSSMWELQRVGEMEATLMGTTDAASPNGAEATQRSGSRPRRELVRRVIPRPRSSKSAKKG